MFHVRPRRLAGTLTALVVIVAGAAVGVPASAAGDPAPAAPVNVQAEAYWNQVELSWEPGQGGSDPVFYRVRNLTTGLTSATTETTYVSGGGIEEGETYTFEIIAVTNGKESPPSDRVVATIPHLDPATDLHASLDGDTITLTWHRPAAVNPRTLTTYGVRINGQLETIHKVGGDVVSLTIPRVLPGTTHEYTVQVSKGLSPGPVSDPATLAVPPSADTTPPTEPEWVIGLDPGCQPGFQIVVESTDDTTPQANIRYEQVEPTVSFGTTESYVRNYDLPLRSSDGPPTGIRAVDEAGNRSAVVMSDEMAESCR
ncbi:fibronectin type III domain-containing protein [Thermasporomyces composti]|uniref:Fibronectin type III domain protein n=1 Tax=Thermasporomyces composti TaxID=696763 RepID=A0A3D9VIM8_THECX|nr:fibronectin type III domain-containing protein [Thermasporomyces composti]REF37171.1 fibronectin type III domain protein [Thermasporomyces composti]